VRNIFGRRKTLISLTEKKKSAFLSVHQRPDLILDNVHKG